MAGMEEQELMPQEMPGPAMEESGAGSRPLPPWTRHLRAVAPRLMTTIGLLTLGAVLGVLTSVWTRRDGGSGQPVFTGDVNSNPAFLSEVAVERKKTETKKSDSDVVSKADSLEHAQDLKEKATSLKAQEEKLKTKAAELGDKSHDLQKDAKKIQAQASKEVSDAAADRKRAKELREKAEELKKEAAGLVSKSADMDKDAKKKKATAEKTTKHADALAKQAETASSDADAKKKAAIEAEQKALDETAAQRICIDMGGVKLQGGSPVTFDSINGPHEIADQWQCGDWCLRHKGCRQAVYTWETKTCELFGEATTQPIAFRERWPFFNSTYCGGLEEKEDMMKMLQKVYDQKPWVPPPHNCSWAGENCIHTKCCADVCKASWDFKTCDYFTCYQKDEHFAGCKSGGADPGWDGTNLGGHPNGEVEPAPEGKLVQGVKLYCFTVVMWNLAPKEAWMSSEGELANHWKEAGKNILQCDDYNLFDGLEGGSVHNIQSFISAWKKVQDDGRWKNNDWSIKVDPDAVFFPEHFRQKILYNLRTPQGSAVYLRNTFYKFQFLGALEALSREAMELYFEKGWECETHLGQEGGEDYWLLQCLEGLGIDYQTDVTLLHDKYAADENCGDPYGVAHHFFKKIDSSDGWDSCWDEAEAAWNEAHQ